MRTMRMIVSAGVAAGFLAVGLAALPAYAAGLSDSQIQAITSLLASFNVDQGTIAQVSGILTGNVQGAPGAAGHASSTPPGLGVLCPQLSHPLSLGSEDNGTDGEVSALQDMLRNQGFLAASSTGFFGPMTEHAVAQFQEHAGVTHGPGLGVVGPMTRDALGKHCGEFEGERGHMMATTSPQTASSTGDGHGDSSGSDN